MNSLKGREYNMDRDFQRKMGKLEFPRIASKGPGELLNEDKLLKLRQRVLFQFQCHLIMIICKGKGLWTIIYYLLGKESIVFSTCG